MKPWYRNSTLQMDDPEMEWLQSKDPASCAVWEWLKSDCQKRDTSEVRILSSQETETVARRLGIDGIRFNQISGNLRSLGWISPILPNSPRVSQNLQAVSGGSISMVKGWEKWQERNRTNTEDALRKQVNYWRQKVETKEVTESSQKPPHFLPKPPNSPQLEERRGEEISTAIEGETPHPIELPDKFPKTVDDAIRDAFSVGCDPTFITSVWNKAVGRGGRDARDVPIRVWTGHVATEWSYEQARRAKESSKSANGHSRQPFISELESQMKAKQRQTESHPANPQSIAYRKNCTDLEKASLRQLRKDISELNNRIASGGQRG